MSDKANSLLILAGKSSSSLKYQGIVSTSALSGPEVLGEQFRAFRRRAEDYFVVSEGVLRRYEPSSPVLNGPEDEVFGWYHDLRHPSVFDDLRPELPGDWPWPLWAVEDLIDSHLLQSNGPFLRMGRNIFEIEDDDRLIIDGRGSRGYDCYLESEKEDLVYEKGDRLFSVFDIDAAQ